MLVTVRFFATYKSNPAFTASLSIFVAFRWNQVLGSALSLKYLCIKNYSLIVKDSIGKVELSHDLRQLLDLFTINPPAYDAIQVHFN